MSLVPMTSKRQLSLFSPAVESQRTPPQDPESITKDWHPHAYQKVAISFLKRHRNAGLFMDPGLGKTSVALKAFDSLLQSKLNRRLLVIAPLRPVYEVWPVETDHWNQFKHLRWTVLHAKSKEDDVHADADMFIINPDGLPWFFHRPSGGRSPFELIRPDVLCIDESSKFKHTNTQRFKLLKPYLPSFKRRWILTGSPNPNGYMDLFGQIYILDLGRALGQFISHYRSNYFVPAGRNGKIVFNWKLIEGGERAIQRAIKPIVMSLSEQDYLKIPVETPNIIRIALPEKARQVYRDLEEEMIAELEDNTTITAVNAAVASMKCCQVASGGIYKTRFKENSARVIRDSKVVHNAKTEALEELVEELQGRSLLLGFEYDHDLERILAAFPKTPYIKGGVTPDAMKKIIRDWNANRIQLLACNTATVAHGLNLQEGQCQHVAFYTVPWDYEVYDQFIRRVRRQGNNHQRVIVHHFIARDTVDEVKLRSMRTKERTQRGLMAALRAYIRRRAA